MKNIQGEAEEPRNERVALLWFFFFFYAISKRFAMPPRLLGLKKNTHPGKNVNLHARSQSLHLAVMAALERFRLFVRSR